MGPKLPGLGGVLPTLGGRASLYPKAGLLAAAETPDVRRRRIWELSDSLHCSIIGTCLTTAELRQILVKMQLPAADKETDHQLHGRAVLLAGRKEPASKLLQKALDRRHRTALNRFGGVPKGAQLFGIACPAVGRAEIPGAYWAVLTHPHTTEDLLRHVFGEVRRGSS